MEAHRSDGGLSFSLSERRREFGNHRIVIAQLLPARPVNHTAGLQPRQPRTRYKDAVAVIRGGGISHPAQGLSKRPVGMRGLPATHEIKLTGEAIEDVALAAQNAHAISFPPVSHG